MFALRHIQLVGIGLLSFLLGCSGGGSSSPTPNYPAPTSLTYSHNPAVYTQGVAIDPNTPTSSGGTVTSFAVSPALPAGLVLNTATGVISGTPSVASAAATYTITASNAGGSTAVNLSITVNAAFSAPTGLTYSLNPAVYTVGVAITPNVPSSGGGAVTSYSVSAALPTGLIINTSTGVISGTPSVASAAATYTITASNAGGSTTANLVITVSTAVSAPTGLTYSLNPAIYILGVPISTNVPSSGGGAVTSYSVSPVLPAGLVFWTTTGFISGTPSVASASATYTVTASNAGGSTTVNLVITVNATLFPPSGLSYSVNPAVYSLGVPITPNVPSSSGGPVASYGTVPALPAGLVIHPTTGVISGTPTVLTPVSFSFFSVVAANSAGNTTVILDLTVVPPSSSGGTWQATGSMQNARAGHTATLLPNGKVLVAGGGNGSYLSSAELYDPSTGTWTTTGSLAAARAGHTATLLGNGKVLVAGGYAPLSLSGAEIYDPATGTWAATGSLLTSRSGHSATLLPSGKVLVAGGYSYGIGGLKSTELYDPSTGQWTASGSLSNAGGLDHCAALLPTGKVLVAGGTFNGTGDTASAELYDPATGTWVATGSLTTNRSSHTATVLQNGKVLVVGPTPFANTAAEVYDPATGIWTSTGSTPPPQLHTATLLPDGSVLVAGGWGSGATSTSYATTYNPATGTWTATGSLGTGRYSHTATLLPNGKVLVAGGSINSTTSLASAEIY